MTTIEHPLPIPVLYDDILTLYALSGTGSTPTHIVNYGGVMGEQYIWASEDIPDNSKCVSVCLGRSSLLISYRVDSDGSVAMTFSRA